MANELVLIEPMEMNPAVIAALFTDKKGIDELLKGIEAKVMGIVPDVSSAKGRKEIASLAYKVAQFKTHLDTLGKDLVADWKSKASKVDESRKHAREFLDALKDRVREPLTVWEKSEADRVATEEAERKFQSDFDAAIIENDLFNRLAEIKRKEAIIDAQKEKELIEQARIAKEKAETEAREADKEHRRKINNAAVSCLVAIDISMADAKKIITAIASGSVKNVTIHY